MESELEFSIKFGEELVECEITSKVDMIQLSPCSVPPIPNLSQEILKQIEPIRKQILTNSTKPLIVIDMPLFQSSLDSILSTLLLGLRPQLTDDDITILLSGSSVPVDSTSYFLNQFNYEVRFHDPEDSDACTLTGYTPSHNNPVELNRSFLEADYTLALSTIIPDTFLGTTGGYSSVLPGITSEKTNTHNLRLTLQDGFQPFDKSSARFKDIKEATMLSCLDSIINIVIDHEGKEIGLISGPPSEAYNKGHNLAKTIASAKMDNLVDLAIVSPGSSPWDKTLYTSVNSLYAAYKVTKRDGVILLVAKCQEGFGPQGFVDGLFEFRTEQDVRGISDASMTKGIDRALFLHQILSSRRLLIYSELSEHIDDKLWSRVAVRSIEEGLELAFETLSSAPKCAIIQNGNFTVPELG